MLWFVFGVIVGFLVRHFWNGVFVFWKRAETKIEKTLRKE